MSKNLANHICAHGEIADSLRDAVKTAAKYNFSALIMPVFCRDESAYIRAISSRDDLMKQARDLFQISGLRQIWVSPLSSSY